MPELPEVETVARQLRPHLLGQHIQRLVLCDEKFSTLKSLRLAGAQISDVRRIGKRVLMECQHQKKTLYVLVHLRMTGRLLWCPKGEQARRERSRAEFHLSKGNLLFVDTRRFGTLEVCDDLSTCAKDGIDPLSRKFTVQFLQDLLAGSNQPIKPWLLRQDKICGLGNIYASEILHRAKIHPKRSAGSLRAAELQGLHSETKKVLRAAIAACGTTFSDFQDSRGEVGNFQEYLRVYGRDAQPCRRCRSAIKRIVQAGRSTYFCGSCQK